MNDWGADALPNDAVGWHRLFGKQGYDFTLPEIRGALRLLGDVS